MYADLWQFLLRGFIECSLDVSEVDWISASSVTTANVFREIRIFAGKEPADLHTKLKP